MRIWLGSFAVLSVAYLGCNANLDTTCVGGACQPLAQSTVTSSTSTTGGSGGGGGGSSCFVGCDVSKPTTRTGEFPCDIEKILSTVCRNCHTNPKEKVGVPFVLLKYEDSQQLYGDMVIFAKMQHAIDIKFMPLAPYKDAFTTAQRKTIIDWACACGPPRDAGAMCQ